MEAKKHPALYASLVILGLAAVTGAVLTAIEAGKFADTDKKRTQTEADVARLLTKEPVALTAENVKTAKETLEKFRAAETEHRAELAGGVSSRFDTEFKGDPGELGSEIKEFVERWHAKLKAEGVPIVAVKPDEVAFGFSRYHKTGVNPTKVLSGVYRQTKIIDFLLKTLIDSKLKDELRFLAIERQPIELIGVNTVNYNKDEVSPVHDAVLKQDGLLRAETLRIKFLARTDVMRRFVNAVTDAHRPVCIRGVEVTVPTKEQLALPAAEAKPIDAALPVGFFSEPAPVTDGAVKPAGEQAAPVAAKPEVVVESAPSVFTITFAYIEAVKPEPPATTPAPANP